MSWKASSFFYAKEGVSMTEQEVYEKYAEKICFCCKGNCDKGITLVKDYNLCTISAKCVDYEKDDSKIEGYKVPLKRTANLGKCIMPELKASYIN